MSLATELGKTGLVMALHKGMWHFLRRGNPYILGLMENQCFQAAIQMVPNNVASLPWKAIAVDHPLWQSFSEQMTRPVIRVGRLCDILTEGQPAIIETPLGKTIVRFDGKLFAIQLPLDDSVLFDKNWKVRDGSPALKMVTT